jgi:S-adenosylhomocysteine hydrolase
MKKTTVRQHIEKLAKAQRDTEKTMRAYNKVIAVLQPLPIEIQMRVLRAALAAKEAEIGLANSRLLTAQQERAAAEAKHAKLQKRVGYGVCPCCHRTFRQLQEHMKRKHPHLVKT